MTYIFESGLAHHIEGLIQQKRDPMSRKSTN